MSGEIPSPKVLREQIKLSNAELQRISSEGAMLGQPFAFVNGEEVVIPPGRIFPEFWNHYLLASTVSHVSTLMGESQHFNTEVDSNVVNACQNKAIALLSYWTENPDIIKTDLELETCGVARSAAQSFQWVSSPPLFHQLENTMSELGNTYSMLISGKKLIGFD